MQALNCCSNAAQPAALYPEEAQQSAGRDISLLPRTGLIVQSDGMALNQFAQDRKRKDQLCRLRNLLNMEDITVMHGFC